MDRNNGILLNSILVIQSLSARRAWIEIDQIGKVLVDASVALRKESVDRNYADTCKYAFVFGRSPQGERG